MKARVSQLHKTETEWQKFLNWTPAAGEIVVYDPDDQTNFARVKIGDGRTILKDLPFFVNSAVEAYIQSKRFDEVIDAGRVSDYKK